MFSITTEGKTSASRQWIGSPSAPQGTRTGMIPQQGVLFADGNPSGSFSKATFIGSGSSWPLRERMLI
ncbi:hypothetical protein, partial [uncultured Akkermansia sp.]|uniref:hypothetical protein n=1 Tax=uncultured Akkermansia sp. TaxID=512294 RepID=UPI00265D3E25